MARGPSNYDDLKEAEFVKMAMLAEDTPIEICPEWQVPAPARLCQMVSLGH